MEAAPAGRQDTTAIVKTRVDRVPELATNIGAAPGSSASATLATPEQALAEVEATRVRGLMSGMTASSAVTMLLVLVISGDRDAQLLHAAALGGSALLTGVLALLFREPKRYHPQLALYAIMAQIVVLVSGYYFWGVFSAYGALVPLTIYIAAGSATRNEAIFGVTACLVAQGAFALATTLGYVEARGLVEPQPERADVFTELVAIGLLQVITIGAAIAGRFARARRTHDRVLGAPTRA